MNEMSGVSLTLAATQRKGTCTSPFEEDIHLMPATLAISCFTLRLLLRRHTLRGCGCTFSFLNAPCDKKIENKVNYGHQAEGMAVRT
mmetsp:Transcript_2269/g.4786  ORF Transcript_2269/g.4786 Transcript_2269/m.4786 type:complete len:87 (+) Transcript_2269:678-938(+)